MSVSGRRSADEGGGAAGGLEARQTMGAKGGRSAREKLPTANPARSSSSRCVGEPFCELVGAAPRLSRAACAARAASASSRRGGSRAIAREADSADATDQLSLLLFRALNVNARFDVARVILTNQPRKIRTSSSFLSRVSCNNLPSREDVCTHFYFLAIFASFLKITPSP
jgi:hypothetical protein